MKTTPDIPFLPSELERHWLDAAMCETRASSDRDALARLLPDIRRLADRYTTERPTPSPSADTPSLASGRSVGHPREANPSASGAYLKTTRAALAYSLYFGALSHARMAFLLSELPPPAPRSDAAPLRVLEFGAGTGAAGFAALAWLHRHGTARVQWDAADLSRTALRVLRDAFTALRPALFPEALLRTHVGSALELDFSDAPRDLILIHYVLNEMPLADRIGLVHNAARLLAPGGVILVCEPLVRAQGDWMQLVRSQLLDGEGLSPLGPCPHGARCEMSEGEICHAVRSFPLPRTLQILESALHRDVRHLAFSWLAAVRGKAPAPANWLRIMDSPRFAHGHVVCSACCPSGQVAPAQILFRGLDGTARKRVRNLERGERLPVAAVTPLSPPLVRAVLPEQLPPS